MQEKKFHTRKYWRFFHRSIAAAWILPIHRKREKLYNVYINGQSYIGMLFRIINDEPAWHRPLWLQMVAPWAGIDPPLLLSSAHIVHCKGKTKEVRLSYQWTVSLFNRNSYKYCKYNSIRCLNVVTNEKGEDVGEVVTIIY